MNLQTIALIAVAAFSIRAYSEPAAPNFARAVYINGVITNASISPLSGSLQALAAKSKEPVDIIINSPGGEVLAGLWFLDTIKDLKARDIKIRCFAQKIVASMAFQIWLHCDERYALEGTVLLWHRVRTHITNYIAEPAGLTSLLQDLLRIDAEMARDAASKLPLPADVISFHAENETRHHAHALAAMTGGNGAWMTVSSYYPGLMNIPVSVPRLGVTPGIDNAVKILYQTDELGE